MQLQRFYGSLDFVRDNQSEPDQKKHSPTQTYRGYQSSLICFLHLLRSMAWHPPVQFMCLTVILHNLGPSFLLSTFGLAPST